MIKNFFMEKIIPQKRLNFSWFDISLFLAVATIPWGNNLNSIMVIFFCIAGAFKNSITYKKKNLTRNYIWVLPVVFFLIMLISLTWDPNGVRGMNAIEKRLSFLLLPIILASLPPLKAQIIKTALFTFVFSVLVVCSLCLIRSFFDYRQTGDYRVFFYQYLSSQMHLNAIYLSLYCIFSLFILFQYYFVKVDPAKRMRPIVAVFLCLFFTAFVLLLSSKTLIFILFLLSASSILYISYLKKMLLKGIVLIILFTTVTGAVLWQLPYVRWRVQSTFIKKYEGQEDDQNGIAVRQKLWLTAIRLIKERPISGYGVKYGNEKLVEKYKEQNFTIAYENQYNSHNTYLQVLVNVGLLGLLPILLLLYISFVTALRQRNYLLFMFLVLVTFLGFTEAVLDGQKGIVFIVLFLFLLIYHSSLPLNSS
jgi:O-antigen ligase